MYEYERQQIRSLSYQQQFLRNVKDNTHVISL